jgi:geranylgeranyl pyrophosphate synthase
MSVPPAAYVTLAAEVDDALDEAMTRILPRLGGQHTSLAPVAAELRAFVAGGKRIRPVLLLLGFEAAGGRRRPAVHGPALALELLHTFALIHDDVIDRAPTRRGRPTVHTTFASRHRDNGWGGDADAYGQAIAILVGDLAFVHADELFLDADVPERALLDAFRRFNVLREEVMVGQYLDLHAAITRSTGCEYPARPPVPSALRYPRTQRSRTAALYFRSAHSGSTAKQARLISSMSAPTSNEGASGSRSAQTWSTCSSVNPSDQDTKALARGRSSSPRFMAAPRRGNRTNTS